MPFLSETAEQLYRRMLKKAVSKAAAVESPGGVPVLTHPPRAAKTALSPSGYVEEAFEVRTPHGKSASRRAGVGRVIRATFSASC